MTDQELKEYKIAETSYQAGYRDALLFFIKTTAKLFKKPLLRKVFAFTKKEHKKMLKSLNTILTSQSPKND